MLRSNFHDHVVLSILFCLLWLVGCGGLPSDFESLSLEEQIAAYERNFARYGGPLIEARAHISWHGWRAADLMADYLTGKRTGLPELEAVRIIHSIQRRGCSLKGTPAERALATYLERLPAESVDAEFAEVALSAIHNNVIMPGGPDGLKGGPCKAGDPARRRAGPLPIGAP